ncbi:MAG: methyltransferase domain-containing protein, partial [Arachnia sp.]
RGRAEAGKYGVEFAEGEITGTEQHADGLLITTADGHARHTRALLVATGVSDELPDIPGLAQRWGTSVLHCPYCHGWEVRDQRLGVLTTSPLGMHQAELIRQWSQAVTVFSAGLGPIEPQVEQRLRSRGLELEPAPVVAIIGEGTAIEAVRLDDGRDVPLAALFTMGEPRPRDGFLAGLDLARTQTPFGSFIAVDPTGLTSHERIWAVGNVVNPAANVAMSAGAGSAAGAAVNAALVTWDFDAAAQPGAWPEVAPADFWEDRYAGSERVWSGKANPVLADVAGTLAAARALDLGCGEGADAIWLAQNGWQATGIDISPTAIGRATQAAEAVGLEPGQARFLAADLAMLPPGAYELISASFLHSPVELPRADILRRATERITPGGHLLITSHASFPPWHTGPHPEHRFLSADEELEQLRLDPQIWDVVVAEARPRQAVGPNGESATIDDIVVLVRRR